MSPADRPAHGPVFALSDALVSALAAAAPIQATMVGVPGHDDRFGDLGPAGADALAALAADYRARLDALPPPEGEWERLAARVMRTFLDERLADHARGEHLLDLNNIDSTFQHLRMVFDLMDATTPAGWADVAARLEALGDAARGYRDRLDEGRRRGRTVAKRQVRAAVEQARVNAGDASYFAGLPAAYAAQPFADAATAARIEAGARAAQRAFAELGGWLEQVYLPAARDADAVGRERYVHAASRFLGATIDPIETYAWGWREVRAIEALMARVAAEIEPGASARDVVRRLERDPSRSAPSREAFLAAMRARQERALAELEGRHFDIPAPLRRLEVKMAPPGGALGAYYVPPSEDLSRPGTVWYAPAEGTTTFPLWSEVTTAYHEGFPGHHLQCGLAVHLADRLSRLHRLFVMYSGYAEGWALYAEQLMHELGYLERPEYVLGMLAAKLMRACRVVVDIGLHLELRIPEGEPHAGEVWSYDLAVETMRDRAFLEAEHARSEVVRYLGWPGQAISYKVGERVILELRDEARRREGAAFDPKAFHARVLGTGSIGLDLLRELVLGGAS